MGWIQKLNEVYDSVILAKPSEDSTETTLIPVGFTQKKIKYLVTLTEEGEFAFARELSDEESSCIVPSTPQAEARTGDRGAPFPLAEQMKYLVQDGEENPRLGDYLAQMKDWCSQPDAPDCLKTLFAYLEKRTLLQDMQSVIKVKYHKDEKEKDGGGTDSKVFVCFEVEDSFSVETRLWMREDVRESWKNYFSSRPEKQPALCYATGEMRKPLEKHPRVQGNAKLISAKDVAFPFQYKGRFVENGSAASVSEYASFRAYSALDYLRRKQGFSRYGMIIVAWNVKTGAFPVPLEEDEYTDEQNAELLDTFEQYASALAKAAAGKNTSLKNIEEKLLGKNKEAAQRVSATVVLGMEAATKGRMSIFYYQEQDAQTYANRLKQWYQDCCWEYWWKDSGYGIRTPSNKEIARAVIGSIYDKKNKEIFNEKKMNTLYKRLLSCIVDGSPLPQSMVDNAVHRAEMPLTFTQSDGWCRLYWENCIRTACAMIRKKRAEKEKPIMRVEVDPSNTNRDYLYGRLFAVADMIEWSAAEQNDKKLPTNAVRMMRFFVQRPAAGWKQLHLKLMPYLARLGNDHLASYYQKLIGQIEMQFTPSDRADDTPLKEDFLLGLYAQRRSKYESTGEQKIYRPSCDRSELFGCMLAVADYAEWAAESELGEKRWESSHDGRTQAMRLMAAFAAKPVRTWEQLHGGLLPYLEKLSIRSREYYLSQLHRIERCFDEEKRMEEKPLNSLFLHGYYCMREVLRSDSVTAEFTPIVHGGTAQTREQAYALLLALENRIERTVLNIECDENENRVSNAVRFMRRYPQQPHTTWLYLRERMKPYARKLKRYRPKETLTARIKELETILEENHWNTDAPLDSGWLHDYYVNYYCKGE